MARFFILKMILLVLFYDEFIYMFIYLFNYLVFLFFVCLPLCVSNRKSVGASNCKYSLLFCLNICLFLCFSFCLFSIYLLLSLYSLAVATVIISFNFVKYSLLSKIITIIFYLIFSSIH